MATTQNQVSGQSNDELFDIFIKATTLKGVLTTFRKLCHILEISPGQFNEFYPAFKKGISGGRSNGANSNNWKSASIFAKIEKKASNKVYHLVTTNHQVNHHLHPRTAAHSGHHSSHHRHHKKQQSQNVVVSTTTIPNGILRDHNCLLVGGGPCGLRTAIELQLLGARHVIVVEKRDRLSRNNVLHLWPFVINDLKSMAGKKFYGKFCAGSIDHVSIRQLQLMLLKFALILGVEFVENVTFEEICPHNLVPFNLNLVSERERENHGIVCQDGHKRKLASGQGAMDQSMSDGHDPIVVIDGIDGNICSGIKKKRHPCQGDEGEEVGEEKKGKEGELPSFASSSASSCQREKKEKKEEENEEPKSPSLTSNKYHEVVSESELNVASSSPSSPSDSSPQECRGNGTTNYSQKQLNSSSESEDQVNCERIKERVEVTCFKKPKKCPCCCHLHSLVQNGEDMDTETGSMAHFSINSKNPATRSSFVNYESLLDKLHSYKFDIVLGADGRRNTLSDHFSRKEFRGKLAIAITANFINTHTLVEAQIPEISGISFIYNQQLFRTLYEDTGIDLENICYYKDDTHYFVMTVKKSSLLARNVLKSDHADTNTLLSPGNINRDELLNLARDAAKWTTGLDQKFALNHYGEPDVAMFDFTSMYAADNACRVKKVRAVNQHANCGHCSCQSSTNSDTSLPPTPNVHFQSQRVKESLLLIGLVGDSLLEPFWPTGSGCGRGFLSSMDSAWMAREWAVNKCRNLDTTHDVILEVLREREAIYRLLGQTKSENLSQNYNGYTLNPVTRYPNFNSATILPLLSCKHLLYDDVPAPIAMTYNETRKEMEKLEKKKLLKVDRARRATIATSSPTFDQQLDHENDDDVYIEEEDQMMHEEFDPSAMIGTAVIRTRDRNSDSMIGKLADRLLGNGSKPNADDGAEQELEDSLEAFEQNYNHGLMTSSSSSAISSTLVSAPMPLNCNDISMSPSASNLATMNKSRAKEIEFALRHRRQQQMTLTRSGSDLNLSRNRNSAPAGGSSNEQMSNVGKPGRVAWFLEQQANLANSDHSSGSSTIAVNKDPRRFNSRIKDLEVKLQAASGLNCFHQSIDVQSENNQMLAQKKLISTKGSTLVMSTATTLEKILNPTFQDEKLKEKAKEYRKKTHDIKVVTKMTPETDWNKKRWEERQSQAIQEPPAMRTSPPTPRPKELMNIFEGKKDDIKVKLQNIDPNRPGHRFVNPNKKSPSKLKPGTKDEWIAMLKGELTERSTNTREPKKQIVVKAPFKSPFKDEDDKIRKANPRPRPMTLLMSSSLSNIHQSSSFSTFNGQNNNNKANPLYGQYPPGNGNYGSSRPQATKIRCTRCRQLVSMIDRVVISGCVFHRSCLTCSMCGISLRPNEITPVNGAEESSVQEFNYICILCSKNKVNSSMNGRPKSSTATASGSKSPKLSTSSAAAIFRTQISTNGSSAHSRAHNSRDHQVTKATEAKPLSHGQTSQGHSMTDSHSDEPEENEYEVKLREKMRCRQNFLMNNNSLDLGSILKRNEDKKSNKASPTKRPEAGVSKSSGTNGSGGSRERMTKQTDEEARTELPPTQTNGASKRAAITKEGKILTSTDGNFDPMEGSASSNNVKSSSSPSNSSGGNTTTTTDDSRGEGQSGLKSDSKQNSTNPSSNPNSPAINERIEFENTSMTYELLDEDEMTKILNIENEAADEDEDSDGIGDPNDMIDERGPVTTHELSSPGTSSSWQKESEDSTSNDFDSDEFDVSENVNSSLADTSKATFGDSASQLVTRQQDGSGGHGAETSPSVMPLSSPGSSPQVVTGMVNVLQGQQVINIDKEKKEDGKSRRRKKLRERKKKINCSPSHSPKRDLQVTNESKVPETSTGRAQHSTRDVVSDLLPQTITTSGTMSSSSTATNTLSIPEICVEHVSHGEHNGQGSNKRLSERKKMHKEPSLTIGQTQNVCVPRSPSDITTTGDDIDTKSALDQVNPDTFSIQEGTSCGGEGSSSILGHQSDLNSGPANCHTFSVNTKNRSQNNLSTTTKALDEDEDTLNEAKNCKVKPWTQNNKSKYQPVASSLTYEDLVSSTTNNEHLDELDKSFASSIIDDDLTSTFDDVYLSSVVEDKSPSQASSGRRIKLESRVTPSTSDLRTMTPRSDISRSEKATLDTASSLKNLSISSDVSNVSDLLSNVSSLSITLTPSPSSIRRNGSSSTFGGPIKNGRRTLEVSKSTSDRKWPSNGQSSPNSCSSSTLNECLCNKRDCVVSSNAAKCTKCDRNQDETNNSRKSFSFDPQCPNNSNNGSLSSQSKTNGTTNSNCRQVLTKSNKLSESLAMNACGHEMMFEAEDPILLVDADDEDEDESRQQKRHEKPKWHPGTLSHSCPHSSFVSPCTPSFSFSPTLLNNWTSSLKQQTTKQPQLNYNGQSDHNTQEGNSATASVMAQDSLSPDKSESSLKKVLDSFNHEMAKLNHHYNQQRQTKINSAKANHVTSNKATSIKMDTSCRSSSGQRPLGLESNSSTSCAMAPRATFDDDDGDY